jgi:hypothetical protein
MIRQTRLWLTDPSSTNKRFGDTTIAIPSERFTNFPRWQHAAADRIPGELMDNGAGNTIAD